MGRAFEAAPGYAELHAISNFTFLTGASHPEELVERAAALGYRALALTDECSLAGIVRAHAAARTAGLHLIAGSRFTLDCGLALIVLAMDRDGYARLARLITAARAAAAKGSYHLTRDKLSDGLPGCLVLWRVDPFAATCEENAAWLRATFGERCRIAVERTLAADEVVRLAALERLAAASGIARVATGGAVMHVRGRRALADTLSAIRQRTRVDAAGTTLAANGERHLRPRGRLAELFPAVLLAEAMALAERCRFRLEELAYEYPEESVPADHTPSSWLRARAEEGAAAHWPGGMSPGVRAQLERELDLVAELGYEAFFLTVDDIVAFARGRGILCQGRGSAANSVLCFCLGITSVHPEESRLLFERFISRERNEPPDIDVDFEHHRREEVIQYVYRRYGAERVALAATVIRYRTKSALRDVGRALGLSSAQLEQLARAGMGRDGRGIDRERVRETGLDPEAPLLRRVLALAEALIGFPRHLSQHVGGLVIGRRALAELVPVENAAMAGRTVIQWDKDDLAAVGLLKLDCLALGMLTVLRDAFERIAAFHGERWSLASLPRDDPDVFAMIQRADTVGVFQIESRAQMSMLPRLKPASFYDLVIEISIVRPGPIQGEMVHPYLRRRQGLEPVDYGGPEIERVLGRTLGVPLFQEQVIEMATLAAGFTPGEADQLRRSMAAWRKSGDLDRFEERIVEGMCTHGYSASFARRLFAQMRGFAGYGFPESHAASFAILAWASCWLKYHYPAAYTAALLNAQPMGFYGPDQLVRDARAHGVEVRGVDVCRSQAQSALEADGAAGRAALRLGLDRVAGLSTAAAERIPAARADEMFRDVADLARRAGLQRRDLDALAAADALAGLAGERPAAHWATDGVEATLPLFPEMVAEEEQPPLPRPTEGEGIVADYRSLGLTLRRHPLALLRPRFRHWCPATGVRASADGRRLVTGGLVITRQQPSTATGVTFLTLEDETGVVNVIVRRELRAARREALYGAALLGVRGRVQREGEVVHVIAERLDDESDALGELRIPSRDFH